MFRCDICGSVRYSNKPIKRNGERICKACFSTIMQAHREIKKEIKEKKKEIKEDGLQK